MSKYVNVLFGASVQHLRNFGDCEFDFFSMKKVLTNLL